MKSVTEIPHIHLTTSGNWKDYQLLDSGDGKTLERFGPYVLIRPEPQVIWHKTLPVETWQAAHAVVQESQGEFGGQWQLLKSINKSWQMTYKALRFQVQLSTSRHLGVFPEQASHWDWITEKIKASHRPLKVLNLFGYTGLATLAAAHAGASVTHVDSSKHALTWANLNLSLSKLPPSSVRWVAEDALKFIQREARRGNKYDGLILDPPKFGRGTDGKVWEFYKGLPELLDACRALFYENSVFAVLTSYAIQASAVITWQAMHEMTMDIPGKIEAGELVAVDESAGHLISHALYARWSTQVAL